MRRTKLRPMRAENPYPQVEKIGWHDSCFKVEPADWNAKYEVPEGFVLAAMKRVRKSDGNWVNLYRLVASKQTLKAMRRRLKAVLKRDADEARKALKKRFRR